MQIFARISLAALFIGAACTPPAPVPPTTTTAAPTAAPSVTADVRMAAEDSAAPDMPQADAPGEVVVRARWKSPQQSIATLAAYAGLPQSMVEQATREVIRDVVREMLGERVDIDSFAALVDATAPVDVVVAVDAKASRPDVYFGTSLGVTSLQKALSASSSPPKKLAEGVWQLGDEMSTPCGILASSGKTPARVVCGDRARDLTVLGPYLARTLPVQDLPGGDIHAEVKLRGMLDKYGQQLATQAKGLPQLAQDQKIGIVQFDEALVDAATAIGDETGLLVRDLDEVSADASIDGQNGFSLGLRFGFAGKSSWLVQTIVDGADLAGPAPDLFWRVPKSAATGAYGISADPARVEPLLRVARALLEGKMAEAKIATDADRKAVVGLLRAGTKAHVAMARASGYFTAQPGANLLTALVNGVVGWHLIGVEDDPKAASAYLNELVKVYNRPSLQAWMKKELGGGAKFLPSIKVVPAPAALGAGSLDVEMAVDGIDDPFAQATGKPKKLKIALHVLAMGDGTRSWVGLAGDRDRLATAMAGAKGASAGPDTLSTVAHLGAFKRDKHTGAGFMSLKGMLGLVSLAQWAMSAAPGGAPSSAVAGMNKLAALVAQLPHQGESPIVVATDVDGGAKPSSSMSLSIPKDALSDVGYIVNQMIAFAQQQQQPPQPPPILP